MARKDYYNTDREKVVRAAMELARKNLTDDIDQYGVDLPHPEGPRSVINSLFLI